MPFSRYWRTLRIDYKQKVDEQKKPWAVRGLKLRGSRRYWYFSMIMHFIAFGPRLDKNETAVKYDIDKFDFDVVRDFMAGLSSNPTERIILSSNKLNVDKQLINNLIGIYNDYFGIISDFNVRKNLDSLKFEKRYENNDYVKLKEACINLHSSMSDVIINLPEFQRKQMIEMFLL